MNLEQVKGIIERILTVVVTYLVAKGYVPQAIGPEIVTAAIGVITVIYGFYVNRASNLAAATQQVTGGTVIVPASVANSGPSADNANVLPSETNKVVAK